MSVEFFAALVHGLKVPPKMGRNAKQGQIKYSKGQKGTEIGKQSKELLEEVGHRAKRPKNASRHEQAFSRRDEENNELISQIGNSSGSVLEGRSVPASAMVPESTTEEEQKVCMFFCIRNIFYIIFPYEHRGCEQICSCGRDVFREPWWFYEF